MADKFEVLPTSEAIIAARARLGDAVLRTPIAVVEPSPGAWPDGPARIEWKLEHLQYGGSFKPRGALTVMADLAPEALARGVVAVSAGNHAIATAYAAARSGVSAKVVMPRASSPVRVARCEAYGAEVVAVDDVHRAFETLERIASEEGRAVIHPFEGPGTTLGAATLGLEMHEQCGPLDLLVVAIGGGGLASGVGAAMKRLRPGLRIVGVEPVGACSMKRSLDEGAPQRLGRVETIADSLGAPFALPYSFSICREVLDRVVLVDDAAIRRAMRRTFDLVKIAAEPAAAAALAALAGPLAAEAAGKRVGLILCGSTIDLARWVELATID